MRESRFARQRRAEGQVEARRADIVDFLRARFGEAAAQLETIVHSLPVTLAGTCSDPDEFRAGLPVAQATLAHR